MKQIFCQILGCWVMVFFIAANNGAMAHPGLIPVSDISLCVDSMETVPVDDELEPTPVSADGGCMVSEAVISI